MRCSNPYCNRGIGLLAHRRGWFIRTALLSKELSLCLRGCSTKTVIPRAECFDLLRVALLATDWNPQQKLIHIKARAKGIEI